VGAAGDIGGDVKRTRPMSVSLAILGNPMRRAMSTVCLRGRTAAATTPHANSNGRLEGGLGTSSVSTCGVD
jgi:hypothetical protein